MISLKHFLETTYLDTCKVIRPTATTDAQGFDVFEDVVIYDIKCGVSFTQTPTESRGGGVYDEATQSIHYLATLFINPEYVVEPGDKVEALVQGRLYKFKTGEGAIYPDHQEVPLIREDKA